MEIQEGIKRLREIGYRITVKMASVKIKTPKFWRSKPDAYPSNEATKGEHPDGGDPGPGPIDLSFLPDKPQILSEKSVNPPGDVQEPQEATETPPTASWHMLHPHRPACLNGEVIYYASDEIIAEAAQKMGLVAFIPEEINAMEAMRRDMNDAEWLERFKGICEIKRDALRPGGKGWKS
jgi:hypothetical protein